MIWILYDELDYEKNKGFVQMITKEAALFHEEAKVLLSKNISFGVSTKEQKVFYEGACLDAPLFCIARTRDFRLSRTLERMGIKVYNSSYVCEICNDKWATYQVVKSLGIPVMDTYLPSKQNHKPQYPFVAKSLSGHGGTEVFMVTNDAEYEKAVKNFAGRDFLCQQVANNPGIDVRVYVLGGKIVKAMKRQSNTDFRSNFCLGGTASVYEMPEVMISYVETLMKHFRFDYAGIDFIFHNGEPVFNEIEDVVGARMLYQYTEVDMVKLYVSYLMEKQ